MSQSVLRLVRFDAAGAGFDAALRDALAPELAAVPGLRAAIGGRMGPGQEGARLVATAWSSEATMQAAVDAGSAITLKDPGVLPGSPGGPPEVLPVAVEVEPEDGARIAIIRVVRGVTRPGELGAYLDDARAGVLGDRSTGGGPLALYLAIDPPDRFLTLSLWGSWSHVEAATGADHEHVERTRHEERLVTWSAEHYEVVPGLAMVRGEG